MQTTENLQTVRTSELRRGDLVLTHGMRVRLDADPIVSKWHGDDTVYAWKGTVENLDEVRAYGLVPAGFLKTRRWCEERRSWVVDREDVWTIQGNDLARWTVVR